MPVIEIGDVEVPARWHICGTCQGEGKSSAYLGAYTREEFDEQFSYEEQQAYFNGEYDRPCDKCSGSGKVLVPDWDNLTEEQREAAEDDARSRREEAFWVRMESGYGY